VQRRKYGSAIVTVVNMGVIDGRLLIEETVEAGVDEPVFINGVSPPLARELELSPSKSLLNECHSRRFLFPMGFRGG